MDFFRRLRTNLKLSRHGWRHLLPHPVFLIAFIILAVTVIWQVGVITELVSTGLKVEPKKDVPAGASQDKGGQYQPGEPPEKPKTFWQKVNIFSDYKEEKMPVVSENRPGSDRLQFSFTELFSGKGWKNESQSRVYQDFLTTSISAPPAYNWHKISVAPPSDGSEIVSAKSSGRRAVLLTSVGNIYSFDFRENLSAQLGLISPPAGARRGFLDFDAEAGKWVAVLLNSDTAHFVILEEENGQFRKLAEFTRPLTGEVGMADPSLTCQNGKCLWLYGSEFLTFGDNARPDPKKEEAISNWFKDRGVSSVSVAKIAGGWLIAKTRSGGEAKYETDIYLWDGELSEVGQGIFSSNYPGRVRLGYDSGAKKLFGIYVAYLGQAFEFSVPDRFTLAKTRNYSRFFNARILGGGAEGSIESFPEIFGQDGAWWVGSTPESPSPRFIKISPSGGAVSLTQELALGARQLFLLPGFEARVIYAILIKNGIAEAYRLNDRGYEQKDGYVWESVRINSGALPIKFGRIVSAVGEGNIRYSLSNDGGASWLEAKLGEFVSFPSDTSDFRWRAELLPSSDQYSSPWLNLATVEYYQ